MRQFVQYAACAAACLLQEANAYYVDQQSCGVVNFQKIVVAMNDVYARYVPATQAMLARLGDGTSSQSEQNLFIWLLGALGPDGNLPAVTRTFNSLVTERESDFQAFLFNSDQLQFFCDESRFTQNTPTDTRQRDQTSNTVLASDAKKCIEDDSTLAWAVKFRGKVDVNLVTIRDSRAQITICPKYWAQVLTGKPQYSGSLQSIIPRMANGFNIVQNILLLTFAGKRQIDTLCTLSCTILHELSHTLALATVHGGDSRSGGKNTGWSAVRALSTVNNGLAAYNNADTMAYLGLGAWLLSQGCTITANGNVRCS